MRISCWLLLLACAAAFGQNRPEAVVPAPGSSLAGPEQWKSALDEWKQKAARLNPPNPQNPARIEAVPAFKPGVCAVPLINVIPPGTSDKMPKIQPPANPRESSGTVKVPAPACERGLFRNLPLPQIEQVNPAPSPKP